MTYTTAISSAIDIAIAKNSNSETNIRSDNSPD